MAYTTSHLVSSTRSSTRASATVSPVCGMFGQPVAENSFVRMCRWVGVLSLSESSAYGVAIHLTAV